jgi:glycosyltransferase involved in cell wall biosynthesis
MKVIFCIPTITKPYQVCLDSLEASIPLIREAGWEEGVVHEIGCPYISHARATMLRKALDAKADVIVFIDHDLSWSPGDLLKLIETEGDVVSGVYRFKKDEEEYMGALITSNDGRPIAREDGCIKAHSIPAGFLKITKEAVGRFMTAYPELCYGPKYNPSVDLFNHGAFGGTWWGEDYAFARRWRDLGGDIWIVPNLNLDHHSGDRACPGNYHQFLLRQPGGSEEQQ